MKTAALCLSLLLLVRFPAPAETGPRGSRPDFSLPRDTREKWVVAFLAFAGERLSAENSYLAYSLPLLLENELSAIPTHEFGTEEIALQKRAVIQREQADLERTLSALRKERDARALAAPQAGGQAGSDPARAAAEERLSAALDRLRFLELLDPEEIDFQTVKPIQWKEGTGAGRLFDPPSLLSRFCVDQGVDLVIGGSLAEVQGYLLLDLWAFDAARGSKVWSYREAGQRDEIYSYVPALGAELTGILLGREWGSIEFTPEPRQGSLYIDGKLVATGRSPAIYVAPGDREIRISAPGYSDVERTVTIAPRSKTSIAATLQRITPETVEISSDPEGADVHMGSVWMGRTPLTLDEPPSRTQAVISLSGYYDQPFAVGGTAQPMKEYVLEKDIVSRDDLQKKARDDFYTAFGWFTMSLPLPLFFWTGAVDCSVVALRLDTLGRVAERDGARAAGNAFYVGYLAGTAASVSLFAWMITTIVNYVVASNRIAG